MADIPLPVNPEIIAQPPQPAPEKSGIEADEETLGHLPAETKELLLDEAKIVENEIVADAKAIETQPSATSSAATVATPAVKQTDEVRHRVEKILEKDLGPLYASLPENVKPAFKKKGEEVAAQIAEMVRTLKVNASKLIKLLREWLLLIPKINRFFLEQEAKIKADEIIEMVRAKKEDQDKKV